MKNTVETVTITLDRFLQLLSDRDTSKKLFDKLAKQREDFYRLANIAMKESLDTYYFGKDFLTLDDLLDETGGFYGLTNRKELCAAGINYEMQKAFIKEEWERRQAVKEEKDE